MRILLAVSTCAIVLSARGANQPVPVQDEPMHRMVFENEYLRIIDVQIPPGETSLYHIHVVPSVIVYLTKSTNRSETWPDKTILTRDVAPGQSRYAPYDEKPLTHRVTNTGPGLFRVFDIELLKKPSGQGAVPKIVSPHVTPHWDETRVRSSGVTLASNGGVEIPPTRYATLIVITSGTMQTTAGGAAVVSPRTLAATDYQFFPPHTRIQLANSKSEKAEGVLLELKD